MWDVAIVFGSFLAAAITAAACAKKAGVTSTAIVGPPAWDFTKSWATNIAVFGALFGTFTTKIVPDPKYVPDPGYPLLSVLFALLALVAPIVFAALSDVKPVKTLGLEDSQSQGTVTGFFIAMLFTLWAALGQIATLTALTFEVINTHKVPDVTAIMLLILLVAAVAVLLYAWRTAGLVLEQQQKAVTNFVPGGNDSMPTWSLL
jgi:hypothetical protein